MPGYKPTLTHRFISLLDKKGRLLRCFTQNIDGLERLAGLPSERLVAAHGRSPQIKESGSQGVFAIACVTLREAESSPRA